MWVQPRVFSEISGAPPINLTVVSKSCYKIIIISCLTKHSTYIYTPYVRNYNIHLFANIFVKKKHINVITNLAIFKWSNPL